MSGIKSLVSRGAAATAVALAACVVLGPAASAQISVNYANTTTGTLNNPGTTCGAALTRTINVPDDLIITDVDLGFIIDHNNRGDTAMALRSPAGTQITMYFGSGGTLNDYNVRFDQDALTEVDTAPQNINNSTVLPPYQFTVRPRAAVSLDVFNGENMQGNWVVLACDNANNGINGTYLRSELFLTGATSADLAFDVTASTTSPSFGTVVSLTATATYEGGTAAANGVQVSFPMPSGLSYQSHTGDGVYDPGTGLWTIPTMNTGDTPSITVQAEVLSSGLYTVQGEIIASSQMDPDSTPNNAATNPAEDDTDAVTLIPGGAGGTGPSGDPDLSCALPEIFDWDVNPWAYTAVVLSRTYPTGGSDNTSFAFAYSGATNRRDTTSGNNNAPETNAKMEGGIAPAEQSLYYWQNLQAAGESVDLTIDVGTPGTGVQDLKFTIFDIDFADPQFRDRIAVQGSFNGSPVTPILTSGSANTSVGSTAVGTAGNNNDLAGGNLIVTFLSPVDQVVINYANPLADTGTSNQAMALHDLTYCPRLRDFGDVATSYGVATHLISGGFQIGATLPDDETATQVSANADGDDLAGTDDEDPVDFSGLIAGTTSNVDVDVTGSGGFLQMWIDWNADGDFDDTVDGVNERVATDVTIVGTTGTASVSVTVPAGATLDQTFARLRWSSASALSAGGTAPDGEVEDHALTIGGAAALNGSKTTQVYDPANVPLYATPGNDVIYTITVSNSGQGPTDPDSVVLIDRLPGEISFFNGDIDFGGPDTYAGTDPVGFEQSAGAGLTFNYGADVRFGTGATAPGTFADCTAVTPDNTYRTDLTFICFNPKGSLAAGDPDPEFSVSFRAKIE